MRTRILDFLGGAFAIVMVGVMVVVTILGGGILGYQLSRLIP